MQFRIEEIQEAESCKLIIGKNLKNQRIVYPYQGTEDIEELNKLKDCQAIFVDGKLLGAWDKEGKPVYSAKGHSMGHDSVR